MRRARFISGVLMVMVLLAGCAPATRADQENALILQVVALDGVPDNELRLDDRGNPKGGLPGVDYSYSDTPFVKLWVPIAVDDWDEFDATIRSVMDVWAASPFSARYPLFLGVSTAGSTFAVWNPDPADLDLALAAVRIWYDVMQENPGLESDANTNFVRGDEFAVLIEGASDEYITEIQQRATDAGLLFRTDGITATSVR